MPIHTIEGISKAQAVNSLDEYGSVVTTNPTVTPWLRIAVGNSNGTGSGNIKYNAQLTFYSKFWDRITQSQS